jgi:hypothetical protein
MIFIKMNKPKYEIGSRIPDSPFTVCGLLTLSNGSYRYFIQVADTDNTFVGDEFDIDDAIAIVRAQTNRLMSIALETAIETLDD